MKQYGTASVYGVDGVVTHTGAAAAVIVDSVESEHTADLERFMSGTNQMLGYNKSNEQLVVDLVLVPKAGTLANALGGLKLPVIPSKVVLDSAFGAASGEDANTALPGDYAYEGGARRTRVKGQAGIRMRIVRYLDTPLNHTQLTTEISA